MLVIALAVVTGATGATALVAAVRDGGEAQPQAADLRAVDIGPSSSTTVEPPATTVATVPSTTAAPATAATAPPSPASSGALSCPSMVALTPRGKLAQLLFVAVGDAAQARGSLGGPDPAGGVLVLGKGGTWFDEGVLRTIASGASVPPLVAADEEGGRVQRIDAVAGPMPSAHAMGQMPPERVREIARARGAEMAKLGFTMDFAPVVDLYDAGNAVINDRAFSADPDKVTTYGRAFAEGLQAAGITPVLKHFPGHGRSTGDSHKQAVQVPPLATLMKADLKPFQALVGTVPAVMVGHLDVPGLTRPGRPTSVSPQTIDDLLRTKLRFTGLVITDDLSAMKAITSRFTVPQAVLASILAGADIAIIGYADMAPVLSALEQAFQSGQLTTAHVDRALGHLAAVKCR